MKSAENNWRAMVRRCRNPRDKAYARYGARGILVCDEWANSYEAFIAHIGAKPSPVHSIDRIDNARGYEPGNVRWATAKEQQRNRTNNRILSLGGIAATAADWAERTGVSATTIVSRASRGKSDAEALAAERISSGVLRGDRNPQSKLTEQAVRDMRSLHATGQWSMKRLAYRYEITINAVFEAVRRKTWRHVV